MEMVATAAIVMGVVLLGIQEHKLSKQEISLDRRSGNTVLGQ
jgi:hypothetical protein